MAVQPYPRAIEAVGPPVAAASGYAATCCSGTWLRTSSSCRCCCSTSSSCCGRRVQTFWLAFYKWNGVSIDREWVGLANFQRLLADPIFWQALQHSLIWTAVVVAFNLVVGLIAAALLAGSIRGRLVFQLGYFLPGGAGVGRHGHDLALDLRADRRPQHGSGSHRTGVPYPGLARRFRRRASRSGHRVELDDVRSQRRHPAGRDAEHRPDAL